MNVALVYHNSRLILADCLNGSLVHLITSVQNPSRFDIIENPLENYHQHEKRFARLCNYFYEFNFN
ncbi:hypothetical protein KZ436_11350, partial [Glaesserella parasuis]|nr:hypothetical protein [Glaesserella parasuis]